MNKKNVIKTCPSLPSLLSIFAGVRFGRVPKGEKEKINQMMMAKNKELQDSFLPSMDISDEDLVDVIRRSHIETSRVTKDNVSNVLANLDESRVVESSQSHKVSIEISVHVHGKINLLNLVQLHQFWIVIL